jgi:hypothetical protein
LSLAPGDRSVPAGSAGSLTGDSVLPIQGLGVDTRNLSPFLSRVRRVPRAPATSTVLKAPPA